MRKLLGLGILLAACAEGGARPEAVNIDVSLGGRGSDEGVRLPFVVDDHFSASGPMGDAIGTLENDPNRCLARPEGAQGGCYAFPLKAGGAIGWSGLYWLEAPNQWGNEEGVRVQPGATRVRFYAASSIPTTATFLVGGILGEAPYPDGFERRLEVSLTPQLTEYEIPLVGITYDAGVQGGFGFTVAPAVDLVLYLDSIRWQ